MVNKKTGENEHRERKERPENALSGKKQSGNVGFDREQIITAIKTVNDPEIGIDIWTLGLIYKIEIDKKAVTITMTLTTPMCPYGPMLMDEVKEKVQELGAIVTLNLVFDPVWQPSEELRAMLGI
jgi:metal-sulfur cluster biosynthetic enzyme